MHTSERRDDSSVICGQGASMILFATLREGRRRDVIERGLVGGIRRRAPGKKGALLVSRMVSRESVCLRRLAGGRRSGIVGFSRFLANERVTPESLIEGWGRSTAIAAHGRHVLAIQDTSE